MSGGIGTMAAELRALCQREAMGLAQIELMALRSDAIGAMLPAAQRSVAVLAAATTLLDRLTPLETGVLALLEGEAPPELRLAA